MEKLKGVLYAVFAFLYVPLLLVLMCMLVDLLNWLKIICR